MSHRIVFAVSKIEVALDINGIPFRVSDTAGIRRTSDIIEKEGVQRAHEV